MPGPLLKVQMWFLRGRRQGLCPLSKVGKTWRFCSISRSDGRRGAFEEDLQRRISRGRCRTKDTFIRDVRRSGRSWEGLHFGASDLQFCWDDFAWQVQHVVRPGINFFRGRHSTLHRWSGKIAKPIGARLPALHSTFHFWRKSRRILSFLMSSISKNEEVSQNCFVSDVVKFKKWRRLAEWFRFGRCYVQTSRNSRRISSFLILQIER